MIAKRILTACALVLWGTTMLPAEAPKGGLTPQNYEQWRKFILPDAWESGYLQIPWRSCFWDGLVDAQKADKPILLWSYGGDPLGSC